MWGGSYMKFSILMVEHILWGVGWITSLYGLYFAFIAIFKMIVKKKSKIKEMPASTRFALLIAARNEAAVIGNLLDSLQQQNYPEDLYDIYVAPNNCTDNTEEIAIAHGGKIFDVIGEISSKGQVLSQFVDDCIKNKKYDAICIFDADNIVDPNFLQKMNNAKLSGVQIAQGLKDSKNSSDSAIATCSSIYFWTIHRFYNASREALNLSSIITGTGFMVSTSFLEEIGGWNTRTITEDYEFSAQCVLAGERICYVPDAIVYDEQPITFKESWKQRKRWSTGIFDNSKYYLKELVKQAIYERSVVCLDMAITYMNSIVWILSLILSFSHGFLIAYKMYIGSSVNQLQYLSSVLLLGFVFCTLFAFFISYTHKGKRIQGLGRGISFFTVYLLSWILINIVSLFNKQRKWEVISHTRTLTLSDI